MASVKYQGTGVVTSADFKTVKYEGITKAGKPIIITLMNAINLGDIDWSMVEKDDTVSQVVFEGCYDNTDEMADETAEPWTIEMENVTAAAGNIMVGVGKFYIDNQLVALTRGGGSFNTGRSYRSIAADQDRGTVVDRVVMDEAKPTLTLNALTILNNFTKLYSAVDVVTP